MGYAYYMTKAGYALQAKLFAEGGDMNITKVEVGSGVMPEDTVFGSLTGLAERRAPATSTTPRRTGCAVDFEIEYRSDLDGAPEEAFPITEFGVYALDVDGHEALILYGDLSDYPESAVPKEFGGCVRRYPVHLEIGPAATVHLEYPAGAWATHEELAAAIGEHSGNTAAHPYLMELLSGQNARLFLLELMYATDVSGNPYTVTFETLTGLVCTGVWNAVQNRLEF